MKTLLATIIAVTAMVVGGVSPARANVIYSYTEDGPYTFAWSFEVPSLLPISPWTFIPIPQFGGDLLVTQDNLSGSARFPDATFAGVMFPTYSDSGVGTAFTMWWRRASNCAGDFPNGTFYTQQGDFGLSPHVTAPFDHFGTYSPIGDGVESLTITEVSSVPDPPSVVLLAGPLLGLLLWMRIKGQ